MMKVQIANCPYCDSPVSTISVTEDWGCFWIKCPRCKCAGPLVEAGGGEDFEKKAAARAIAKWNASRETFARRIGTRVQWLK